MLFLLAACTEYGLADHGVKPDEPLDSGSDPVVVDTGEDPVDSPPVDTGTVTETADSPDVESVPPEETAEEELPVDCTGVDFGTWQWWGSQPFTTTDGPTDDWGKNFYETDYSMVGWSTIGMPEQNVPVGQDKAYRTTFDLAAIPPNMTLTFSSDDGLWLWVNGVEIGHWGGDWQEEGCVNEGGACDVLVYADPVDVTDLLVVGTNTIAGRVSNAVVSSWFEVEAGCAE